jgi:hypothetical protein
VGFTEELPRPFRLQRLLELHSLRDTTVGIVLLGSALSGVVLVAKVRWFP